MKNVLISGVLGLSLLSTSVFASVSSDISKGLEISTVLSNAQESGMSNAETMTEMLSVAPQLAEQIISSTIILTEGADEKLALYNTAKNLGVSRDVVFTAAVMADMDPSTLAGSTAWGNTHGWGKAPNKSSWSKKGSKKHSNGWGRSPSKFSGWGNQRSKGHANGWGKTPSKFSGWGNQYGKGHGNGWDRSPNKGHGWGKAPSRRTSWGHGHGQKHGHGYGWGKWNKHIGGWNWWSPPKHGCGHGGGCNGASRH